MQFGNTLYHTIKRILNFNQDHGPFYLSKSNLAGTYIWLRLRMEDVPSVSFLIPIKTPTEHQIASFHLSLTMGYIDSAY